MWPRDYLSHSQKSLWKSSKKAYYDRYLYDKTFSSIYTKFGSKMANALEYDEETDDEMLNIVMELLPKFEMMDKPTDVEMNIGGKIKLHGRMDSRKEDHSAFKEYKSGKYKPNGKPAWTQAMVDKDAQITFYATMCYLITKKIPTDIELVWAVTEINPENSKEIIATGEIYRFTTYRTISQIINEMADIKKVWREIGQGCAKELLIN